MKAAQSVATRARTAGDVVVLGEPMKPGSYLTFTTPTTPEKRRAAVDHLLRNMPPAVKPGEKPAHVLLAEERAGG